MLLASTTCGGRVGAQPGLDGICPICDSQLIPKCGDINIWHWCHRANKDCDPWAEPETQWHADWKLAVSIAHREVTVGNHRADIKLPNGTVIELQSAYLSPAEIAEREEAYGSMIWIFNVESCREYSPPQVTIIEGRSYIENGTFPRLQLKAQGDYYTFHWKWGRKHIGHTTKPTYLDFGDGNLFRLKKMYLESSCAGWGHLGTKDAFIEWLHSHEL